MTDIAEHLGGYTPGGDPATYYPDLWSFFHHSLGVESVLDIGCGDGQATKFFRDLGCTVMPVDGVDTGVEDMVVHDYTRGFGKPAYANLFDLGWCCEFVEHLEERYLPNLVASLVNCRFVAITHAFPGQLGHHHVNCRTPDYWKGFFASIGFTYDDTLTQLCRTISLSNTNEYNHFYRSGLVFYA